MSLRSVCMFAASTPGNRPVYRDAAACVGRLAAEAGLTVVYGGGSVGLMGALADSALAAGGCVIGVIPEQLVDSEGAHVGLTELHVVDSMSARKALMAELSDAFIALPGGIGTLEEMIEVFSWRKLGIHDKPCGLLDVDGFYEPLGAFLDRAVAEGFLTTSDRALLSVETDPAALLSRFQSLDSHDTPQ
jgi:uncharacterized protein (TIGR00730 family)